MLHIEWPMPPADTQNRARKWVPIVGLLAAFAIALPMVLGFAPAPEPQQDTTASPVPEQGEVLPAPDLESTPTPTEPAPEPEPQPAPPASEEPATEESGEGEGGSEVAGENANAGAAGEGTGDGEEATAAKPGFQAPLPAADGTQDHATEPQVGGRSTTLTVTIKMNADTVSPGSVAGEVLVTNTTSTVYTREQVFIDFDAESLEGGCVYEGLAKSGIPADARDLPVYDFTCDVVQEKVKDARFPISVDLSQGRGGSQLGSAAIDVPRAPLGVELVSQPDPSGQLFSAADQEITYKSTATVHGPWAVRATACGMHVDLDPRDSKSLDDCTYTTTDTDVQAKYASIVGEVELSPKGSDTPVIETAKAPAFRVSHVDAALELTLEQSSNWYTPSEEQEMISYSATVKNVGTADITAPSGKDSFGNEYTMEGVLKAGESFTYNETSQAPREDSWGEGKTFDNSLTVCGTLAGSTSAIPICSNPARVSAAFAEIEDCIDVEMVPSEKEMTHAGQKIDIDLVVTNRCAPSVHLFQAVDDMRLYGIRNEEQEDDDDDDDDEVSYRATALTTAAAGIVSGVLPAKSVPADGVDIASGGSYTLPGTHVVTQADLEAKSIRNSATILLNPEGHPESDYAFDANLTIPLKAGVTPAPKRGTANTGADISMAGASVALLLSGAVLVVISRRNSLR